ncbi:hypothetical protein WJX81_005369 [Elliptochloris bilobata]|uniref:Uncharacterized protein n=1 Tax=Elliptochloris bilobata TaxID=381761 RepID=A0AAW1RKD8_9CHLO
MAGVHLIPGPLGTISQLLHLHAGPIAPGQGFLPLGNLLTSDFVGPYNLSLLSTQENEVKATIAFKANYTDADLVRSLTNVECLEAAFDLYGAFRRNLSANLTLGGPAPLGAKKANLTEAVLRYVQEIALTQQGHLLFTRQAGSTDPCPLTVAQKFAAPFNPFLNDANFVLSMLLLEELGAIGNRGVISLVTNPVLANGVAGLATSASTFAGIERFLLYQMRKDIVKPFGETVQKVFARVSALRDSLDGPQLDDQGLVNADPRFIVVPDGLVNLVPTDIRGLTFSRTPAMVINILTLGSPSGKGSFFPKGLSGPITSPAGYDASDAGTKSIEKAVATVQETVVQLGYIAPPITGATPATVFGDEVVYQALTGVLDSGNASARGLTVLPVFNDIFVDPETAANATGGGYTPKVFNGIGGIICCNPDQIDYPDECPPSATFNIVKWVADVKFRNNPVFDIDIAAFEVVPTNKTNHSRWGRPLQWGSIFASKPCSMDPCEVSHSGFPATDVKEEGCKREFGEKLYSSTDTQKPDLTCYSSNSHFPANRDGTVLEYEFSTCGGASGSPLIETSSNKVIALLSEGDESCDASIRPGGGESVARAYFAQFIIGESSTGKGVDPTSLIEQLAEAPVGEH